MRIEEQDGVENILAPAFIETTLKASAVTMVGIIVDANGDPAARWEQLRARLAGLLGAAELRRGGPRLPRLGFDVEQVRQPFGQEVHGRAELGALALDERA